MDAPLDRYQTLAGAGIVEQTVRRSRFLATAVPVGDEITARRVVADLRRQHHDARHVCSAWRLGGAGPVREARHDDGEPSGTAGEPILQAIRGENLTDVVVAVVRWFGGIKLGTGGLARVYCDAAAAAVAAAPRRTVHLGRTGRLRFAYARQKSLPHLLAAHGGRIEAEDYGAEVTWRVWLPLAAWDGFVAAVREATGDQVAVQTDTGGD